MGDAKVSCQVQGWNTSHKNCHQPLSSPAVTTSIMCMSCHLPTPSLGSTYLLGPWTTPVLCLASGAGHDLQLPINAGSLFFNCNPAFELSIQSDWACNCNSCPSFKVWVLKCFMHRENLVFGLIVVWDLLTCGKTIHECTGVVLVLDELILNQ